MWRSATAALSERGYNSPTLSDKPLFEPLALRDRLATG
jgi:hypothetical protein